MSKTDAYPWMDDPTNGCVYYYDPTAVVSTPTWRCQKRPIMPQQIWDYAQAQFGTIDQVWTRIASIAGFSNNADSSFIDPTTKLPFYIAGHLVQEVAQAYPDGSHLYITTTGDGTKETPPKPANTSLCLFSPQPDGDNNISSCPNAYPMIDLNPSGPPLLPLSDPSNPYFFPLIPPQDQVNYDTKDWGAKVDNNAVTGYINADLGQFGLTEDWVYASLLLTVPVGIYSYTSGKVWPLPSFLAAAFIGPYIWMKTKDFYFDHNPMNAWALWTGGIRGQPFSPPYGYWIVAGVGVPLTIGGTLLAHKYLGDSVTGYVFIAGLLATLIGEIVIWANSEVEKAEGAVTNAISGGISSFF
jgi:hypothetical protein